MGNRKTTEIVYGAMMLAIYGLLMILDTYTGAMLNVLLYYLMPLPFVVYGLKFGMKMTGCVGIAALIIGLMLGLPETIFFSFSAIIISLVLLHGIIKKRDGGLLFIEVMVVTTLAQVLSLTAFASLLGYSLTEELAEIESVLGVQFAHQEIFLPLFCLLVGGLEAFIFTSFTDLLLLKLRLERVPKFSLLKLHLPKWVGIATLVGFASMCLIPGQISYFFGCCSLMILCAQGLSYVMFYTIVQKKSRWLVVLAFFLCFVPYLGWSIAALGLFDIFSENRQKLLYNRNNS